MSKKSTLLLLLFCIFINQSCKKQDLDPYPKPLNPNLKYFGYTLVDVGFNDPTDMSSKTNYIDEVAYYSNIADILVTEPTDNIVGRMQVINQYGVKAVIHLFYLLFEETAQGGGSGHIYSLRADYQSRINDFISTNNLTVNSSLIEFFYIGEEPTWNGVSHLEFKTACDYVKATLPSVKLLYVEAYAAVDNMEIPSSIDIVGFDHFFLKDPKNSTTYKNELNTLKSKRSNVTQKIMLIMDAHFILRFHGSVGIGKRDLEQIAAGYYQLANNDNEVVGILCYHWPSGFDTRFSDGSRNLPKNVLNEHKRIGQAITGK